MTPSSPTCDHFPPPGAPGFTPSRGDRSRPGVVRVHPGAPTVTERVSATSRGSTATCSCTTWDPIWSVSRWTSIIKVRRWSISRQRPAWPTGQSGARRHCGATPLLLGPTPDDGRAENLADAVKLHKGQAPRLGRRPRPPIVEAASGDRGIPNSLAAPPSADPEPGAGPGNRHPVLGPLSSSPTTGKTSQPVRRVAKTRSGQEPACGVEAQAGRVSGKDERARGGPRPTPPDRPG